jgi:hypothetical protein
MIWPFNRTDTDLDQASLTLDPFVAEALTGVEKEQLFNRLSTRTLVECYVYGAVRYLASYDDMRPASAGILLERILASHFDASSNEVTTSQLYFSSRPEGDKEQLFMIEGASALRRWLVEGDRSVGSNLRELLETSH